MHEIGMCEGVIGAVEARANGRQVGKVRVRVGAALRVVPDAFSMAFELVAYGSVAEGTEVDLVVIGMDLDCQDCGAVTTSTDPLAVCAACGGGVVVARGGDELTLESIEYRGLATSSPEQGGS